MSFDGDLYPTAGASSVMTTKGDMVDFDTARQRLGIGSANQVLSVSAGGLPTWTTTASAGGKWEKLAYVTGGGAGTLDTPTFTAKDFLKVFFWSPSSGGTRAPVLRVGSGGSVDAGSNYNYNRWNAGVYETGGSQTNFMLCPDTTVDSDFYSVIDIMNIDGQAKSIVSNSTVYDRPNSGSGGGGWGTLAQINIIQLNCAVHGGSGATVGTASLIEVWGADQDT